MPSDPPRGPDPQGQPLHQWAPTIYNHLHVGDSVADTTFSCSRQWSSNSTVSPGVSRPTSTQRQAYFTLQRAQQSYESECPNCRADCQLQRP